VYSTSVNYYIPRHIVVLYMDSVSSFRSYNIVYAKNLKLHKGADNKIQFQFLNQEQKPIDITGKTVTVRLMNYDATEILLQKSLTNLYALTGIATLPVTSSELMEIDGQFCHYSLVINDNDMNLPVFVDDTTTARGVIEIVNSVIPRHVQSSVVTIEDHADFTGEPITYYSDEFVSMGEPFVTIQTELTDYAGNIIVQGSVMGDSDWYDITEEVEYDGYTSTDYQNVEGIHPYIRVKFVSTAGSVGNILIR